MNYKKEQKQHKFERSTKKILGSKGFLSKIRDVTEKKMPLDEITGYIDLIKWDYLPYFYHLLPILR